MNSQRGSWSFRALVAVAGLMLAACGSQEDTTTSLQADGGDERVTTTEVITASTLETQPPDAGDGSNSREFDEPTTTGADGTTTTRPQTSLTQAESTAPPTTGQLVSPGDYGAFTSPSGNIACVMDVEFGASCWISEKQWTIDQPSGPDCEELDYGNAVDVTASGVVWPCYSDFSWDPGAPALPYGDRMEVGQFRCISGRDGVTCSNQAEQGFRVARAIVEIF